MRCHTNVSKSLWRVSLVQRTRRQARCLLQRLRYLLYAPPNGQCLYFGGSGRKAGAHTRPAWPKIPTAPSAFPVLAALLAPGNKPNSSEGGKSLWGHSSVAGGNLKLPKHIRPDPCRSKHGRPKRDPTTGEAQCYYSCGGICSTPYRMGKCGTRPFFRWVRARAGAHTRSAWPKIPTAPSAFPLLVAPQTPGNKSNPSRRR